MATTVLSKVGFGGTNKFGIYEVTGGTAGTTAEILIQELEGVAITGYPTKGAVVMDLTARNSSSAMNTYLSTRITPASTETVTVTFEDGSQIQDSTASGAVTKDIVIYALKKAQSETVVRVFVGLAIVSGDTGSVTTSAGAFNETPLQFTSVATEEAITIPILAFTEMGLQYESPAEPYVLAVGSYGAWIDCTVL